MRRDDQLRLPDEEQEYREHYFQKIEALFAALRGRSLLLSPADYQLAKSWFDKGIPLSCVLRGIRAAYLKKLAEAEEPDDEVRSLSWCRWAVKREWKEYCSVPVEPSVTAFSPPERTGDEIVSILEGLRFDVARSSDSAASREFHELAKVLRGVAEELSELRKEWKRGKTEAHELEERLQQLDERMMSAAESYLDEETRSKIERSVSRKLRQHADSMDEEILEKTRRCATRSKVRMTLQLPILTLYIL